MIDPMKWFISLVFFIVNATGIAIDQTRNSMREIEGTALDISNLLQWNSVFIDLW